MEYTCKRASYSALQIAVHKCVAVWLCFCVLQVGPIVGAAGIC